MSKRPALRALAASALLVLTLAACVSPSALGPDPSDPVTPVEPIPDDPATEQPDGNGNVLPGYPELSVERAADGLLVASVADPGAKAWRLVVTGGGAAALDRLEVLVETGDVFASVLVSEVQGGEVVDVVDLTGLAGDATVAAGGCHRTLPVCFASADVVLPTAEDPALTVRFMTTDLGASLELVGGTARWPGEPFVLGPWAPTHTFSTSD